MILSPSPSEVDLEAVRWIVQETKRQGGTYHKLDFGDGYVIDGQYDMSKYLPYYQLPDDLSGRTVLDVGTATGFFAIESERRGGKVTALDIWDPETALVAQVIRAFKLNINFVSKNMYDLDPSFGQFDLVVCGSLLLHLPDPVGALRALRAVTGERLIISSAATEDSATTDRPVCDFIGDQATEDAYWYYWAFSACGLERMLKAAGFSRVENVRHFVLSSEPDSDRMAFATPHVAMSAYV